VLRRRHVAVGVAFLQRPLQVRSDLARVRRPTAAVADRDVSGLSQVKSHLGRIHRRTERLETHHVVRKSIVVQINVEVIRRSTAYTYVPLFHLLT